MQKTTNQLLLEENQKQISLLNQSIESFIKSKLWKELKEKEDNNELTSEEKILFEKKEKKLDKFEARLEGLEETSKNLSESIKQEGTFIFNI